MAFQRIASTLGSGAIALSIATAPAVPVVMTALAPDAAAAVRTDGPHSPVGRHVAPTTVTRDGDVTVSRYDLGDVEIGAKPGQFRAPLRGSLITPTQASGPSKVVVISHLRAAGCADGVFAFPCPGGEMRLDRGMEYLGKALAEKGYTVLIPDVAPVWIGTTLKAPYDQVAGWLKVVGSTRTALMDDVRTGSRHFGLDLRGRVDLSGMGLVVHSRSGFIAGPAAQAWRASGMPVTSVLAYGPAYEVPDAQNHVTAPVPGDLPYLGVVGEADHDVPFNADLWLAGNIEQRRTAPALVATVPGLGHDFVNTTLSGAGIDDRLGCDDGTCSDAADHQRFLTTVAGQYFDATMRATPSAMPLAAQDALPRTLAGKPARWLAATNATDRVTVFDADSSRAPKVSSGSTSTMCRFYDPQDPTSYADKCPDAGLGAPLLVSKVARVKLAKGGSFTVPTRVRGAHQVDLQIANYSDRPDGRGDSPLSVSLTTSDGRRVALTMPAGASDVTKNRATSDENGTYVLGTLRIPVPQELGDATMTGIEVTAPAGGDYALRAVDVRGTAVASGSSEDEDKHAQTPGGSGAVSPASHVSSGKPTAVGPLVQTDGAVDDRRDGASGALLLVLGVLGGAWRWGARRV